MKLFKKPILILVTTCILTFATTWPVLAQASSSSKLPPALIRLKHRLGLTVIKSFPTETPAMTGYVVKRSDGKAGLLFSIGPYLISGTLIDANGNDATARFAQQELPQPDYQGTAQQLAKDPTLITEGKSDAPAIFVFADPNCIFCHEFWKKTRAWVNAGKLRIHWVMVGFLKASSAGKAAAMMAKSKGNSDVVNEDEKGFDTGSEEGAIKPLSPIPQPLKQALHQHGQMMSKLGFSGTPSLIYQDQKGQWHGSQGLPDMAKLGNALGIHQP